jgi:NAD(P)H-quinone oxidoreductase subunit 5
MTSSLLLLAAPLLPIIAAATASAAGGPPERTARRAVIAAAAGAAAAAIVLVITLIGRSPELVATTGDGSAWIGLTADRATAVLAALTALVGLVVQSYGARALEGDPRLGRFSVAAGVLTGATATVAYAATLWLLVVGWVATSAALVVLLRHRSGWKPADRAVRLTGRTFAVGDLALVAATVVWAVSVGDLDLRRADAADQLGGALPVVAILLVLAGLCRSALVPGHRWLPSTIVAPTPVSALLHAGVVNGLGVLAIRTSGVIGGSAAAMWLLFVVGTMTAVLATSVMLVRPDVKGALAWSTGGQMGFMAVQIAVGAFAAALFHIVGHALYKATLFLGAGGAITAHASARHRPHATRPMHEVAAAAVAAAVPAATLAAAIVVIDPHLSTSGTVLVATFGWLSGAALLRGWLAAVPARPAAIATGAVATVLATAGYVAGLAAFEHAVAPAVPFSVIGEVPASALIATLVTLAAMAAVVRWLPGRGGAALRNGLYGALLGYGAPRMPRAPDRRAGAAPATVPKRADSAPVFPSTVPTPTPAPMPTAMPNTVSTTHA